MIGSFKDVVTSNKEHQITYLEIVKLINRHAHKMTALEVLAVAANLVGKLVAMQDMRTVTPERAMEIVARNIEIGNKQVIENLGNTKETVQ